MVIVGVLVAGIITYVRTYYVLLLPVYFLIHTLLNTQRNDFLVVAPLDLT